MSGVMTLPCDTISLEDELEAALQPSLPVLSSDLPAAARRADAVSSAALEGPALAHGTGAAPLTSGVTRALQPERARCTPGSKGKPALCTLPRELLARVLENLAATDLCSAACCCKLLSELSRAPLLWQRLYLTRWSEKQVESSSQPFGGDWQASYRDKDAEDIAEACRGFEGLHDLYREMAVSKRSLPPCDKSIQDNTAPGISAERAVSDWRSARGLRQAALSPPGSKHGCVGAAYSRVGRSTFLCNRCGWMHVCDANCSERILQRGADLPACPISGIAFDIVMNEWEEVAEGFRDDQEQPDMDDGYARQGRLGVAWSSGYNCGSLAELHRLTGRRLQ